jgi:hypothetical protein
MIVAKLSDGTLLLGLSRTNIERLMAGQPIRVSQATHGVELPESMPRIGITFGETEAAIAADIQRVFGDVSSNNPSTSQE